MFSSARELDELNALLAEFEDTFDCRGPPTKMGEHQIDTRNHPLITVPSYPSYRMSPVERQVLREEIDKFLRDSIIEQGETP